ncbi:transporter substrate-binding domain-containing protein [Pseudomonas sp. LPB0260]|uniref:substrate-binding periplasmic protein n=1 Tax=Pseudomonas sp. LPB0260 TaxID=2614442 RepID=UPI0015C27752|nr:transporter substrate-binding domain-containing protein [Pseudomonas sp. LPB0260]QLC73508.1 transporter substrate-binding domain-containing protein [Pseudomonas sp. LPB0260]QLC76282.1 transporter substrate-binding domain-containing protein [Pseudomonas sp. LPB0260]
MRAEICFSACLKAFACAALMLASPADADEAGLRNKIITVAFYEAGHLYSNGAGIDMDVITELQRRGGYRFKLVEQPRVRIWKDLQNGVLPMSVSGIRNAERDQFAYFIPYLAQRNKALVSNPAYRSADSLANDTRATIAVVRGFRHGEFFDGIIERVRAHGGVREVPSIRNLFLMLKAGNRVDMIIALPVFYDKELEEHGLASRLTINDWDPDPAPILHNLILSKVHFSAQDRDDMQAIIDGMKADGTLEKIFLKYLPAEEAEYAANF